ncbi:MAG: hypothetical protein ACL93V_02525 [Candidatus Electrothrix sp. YB6]
MVVVVPAKLTGCAGVEVLGHADVPIRAPVVVLVLAVEGVVLGHRVQAVEHVLGALVHALGARACTVFLTALFSAF